MKTIDISTPTHPNTFLKIDDDDFALVSQWKWTPARSCSGLVYVTRFHRKPNPIPGKRKIGVTTRVHVAIMGPPPGSVVDHIDGDPLNNQRSNLRVCTAKENGRNRRSLMTTRKYKGPLKRGKKFVCRIIVDTKAIYLGTFDTEDAAALAYNVAAVKYYGEFANLNVVPA